MSRASALALGLAVLGAWAASEAFECAPHEAPAAVQRPASDLSLPTRSELGLGEPEEMPALTF